MIMLELQLQLAKLMLGFIEVALMQYYNNDSFTT
jgi:hypothetical protein